MEKFLTDRSLNFEAMKQMMASLWSPGNVKELTENLIIFQLYHEVDIKRIIKGNPWSFKGTQLVFETLKSGKDQRSQSLNCLDMWVQIHGMQPCSMSLQAITTIGNYVGSFFESD